MINPQDIEDLKSSEEKNEFSTDFIEEFTDSYVNDEEYTQPKITTEIREEK